MMKKLLVICGPTATGKTEVGIKLAKKFNGEIVSADSRQVYIGMDVGTGKDLPANSKLKTQNSKLQLKTKNYQVGYYLFDGIPVWMLDVVRPNQQFSVAQYVQLAWKVIFDIWNRKRLPIIVGGTGFYIKALLDGVGTLGIPPNWPLRLRLNKLSVNELFEMLGHMDSLKAASLNASDRKNPRRLIRAIEIANAKTPKETKTQKKQNVLSVGLTAPNSILYQRINKRVKEQIKQGAQKEVEKLLKNYRWENSVLGETLGYKEWRPYFEGKVALSEVIERWQLNEHDYARRQMTWFKKALRPPKANQGYWFDICQGGWENKIEKLVSSWYTKT